MEITWVFFPRTQGMRIKPNRAIINSDHEKLRSAVVILENFPTLRDIDEPKQLILDQTFGKLPTTI